MALQWYCGLNPEFLPNVILSNFVKQSVDVAAFHENKPAEHSRWLCNDIVVKPGISPVHKLFNWVVEVITLAYKWTGNHD